MSAPKKIWFDREECSAGPVKFNDDEVPYIRADIVDELVEALVDATDAMTAFAELNRDTAKARAALAKLEEKIGRAHV